MLKARSKEDYVAAVRVLVTGFDLRPLHGADAIRSAPVDCLLDSIQHPRKTPIYGYQPPTWWRASATFTGG